MCMMVMPRPRSTLHSLCSLEEMRLDLDLYTLDYMDIFYDDGPVPLRMLIT